MSIFSKICKHKLYLQVKFHISWKKKKTKFTKVNLFHFPISGRLENEEQPSPSPPPYKNFLYEKLQICYPPPSNLDPTNSLQLFFVSLNNSNNKFHKTKSLWVGLEKRRTLPHSYYTIQNWKVDIIQFLISTLWPLSN